MLCRQIGRMELQTFVPVMGVQKAGTERTTEFGGRLKGLHARSEQSTKHPPDPWSEQK